MASQRPVEVATTRFVEQLMTGGSMSFTDTVNEQERVLPVASVAVHVTGVTPC
jgi:hypothetical protein